MILNINMKNNKKSRNKPKKDFKKGVGINYFKKLTQ